MRSNHWSVIRLLGFMLFALMLFLPTLVLAEVDITDKVEIIKGRMISDRRTGDALIDVSIKNISADLLFQPVKVVVDQISSSSVSVANADGFTDDGKPFFLYSDIGDVFEPNESSLAKRFVFNNPSRVRFSYVLKVIAQVPEVAGVVGLSGGNVEVLDEGSTLLGVQVTFPSGTFEKNEIISISVQKNPPSVPLPEGVNRVGEFIEFNSTEEHFNKPVIVTVPFDGDRLENESRFFYGFNEVEGRWEAVSALPSGDANIFVGVLRHFSTYVKGSAIVEGDRIVSSFEIGRDTLRYQNNSAFPCEYERPAPLNGICSGIALVASEYFNSFAENEGMGSMCRFDLEESAEISCSAYGEFINHTGKDWWENLFDVKDIFTIIPNRGQDHSSAIDLIKQNASNNLVTPLDMWPDENNDGVLEFGHSVVAIGWERTSPTSGNILIYDVNHNDEINTITINNGRLSYKKDGREYSYFLVPDWINTLDVPEQIENFPISDSDNDGVTDICDMVCPQTPEDQYPNGDGCSISELFPILNEPIWLENNENNNFLSYEFSTIPIDHPSSSSFSYCIVINDEGVGVANGDQLLNTCEPPYTLDNYDPVWRVYDLLPETEYSWTVFAVNQDGVWSGSEWGNFITEPLPVTVGSISDTLLLGFDALSGTGSISTTAASTYLAAISHFLDAGSLVGLDTTATTNEIDQALFFSSLARLAQIADPYSDLTNNGLNNLGDILDAFGVGGTNADRNYLNQIPTEDCTTVVDWTDPDTGYQYTHEECSLKEISSNSPTSGELQQFLTDKVVSELQIAIENLGKVSTAFKKEWTDPADSSVTEFDCADALAVKGFMQAMLAQIKLTNAYNFDVSLVDEQQAANTGQGHRAGDVLALNPNLGALKDQASLDESKTYIELSANTLISAINAMDQENSGGDDQSDDLISFYSCGFNPTWSCGYDSSESSAMKDELLNVARSMVLSTDTEFESPVDGNIYPVTVRFFNIFNGLDIRNQLPVVTDNTTGFFPDPTLNGVIDPTQFDINEDRDADGHPDLANNFTNFFEDLVAGKEASGWFSGPEGEATELFKFHSDHTIEYQWHSYSYATNQEIYGEGNGQWEIDSSTGELVVAFPSPINTWISDGQMDSIRVDLISGEYLGGEVAEHHFLGSTDLTPLSLKSQWRFSGIQSYGLFPQINPYVTVNPSVGYVSESTLLEEYGYGFVPNGPVKLHLIDPNGIHSEIQVTADNSGNHYHTYQVNSGTVAGEWEYYAIDETTGTQTASVFIPILLGDTTPSISPYVTASPTYGFVSDSTHIQEPGYGFSPNGSVTLHFIDPNGIHTTISKNADVTGSFYHDYTVHSGSALGWWGYYAVDNSTGITTDTVNILITNPAVSVSPTTGSKAVQTTFVEPLSGFTPNGAVILHFVDPNGVHTTIPKTADSSGSYPHNYTAHSGTAEGQWEYYAVDGTTGRQTDSVYFFVNP